MHVLGFKLALKHLSYKPFSRVLVILSISSILLLNAFVFLFYQNVKQSLQELRSSQEITAYVEPSVSENRERMIFSAVKKINGVQNVKAVSREAFLKNFGSYFPNLANELVSIDMDVIPRYLKIRANNPNQVEQQVKRIQGVEYVESFKNHFAGAIKVLLTLKTIALVLFLGLGVVLFCVLFNHFKIETDFTEQFKRTMKSLGAKNHHIYLPLTLEGAIEGTFGGLIAAALVFMTGSAFQEQLNNLFFSANIADFKPYHIDFASVTLLTFVAGSVVGLAGSIWNQFWGRLCGKAHR